MRRIPTNCCLLAVSCLLIPSGVSRADLSTSDAYPAVGVSRYDATPLRQSLAKDQSLGEYQFDRALRPYATDQFTPSVTTHVTPLALPGDTTAGSATSTATLNITGGSLFDGSSVTTWPGGRYTESTQSWADSGGTVTGSISEVPLPASALLALIGLGIAGAGRSRSAFRG